MSLNFQFDPKTWELIKDQHQVNEVVLHSTIFVGVNHITPKNVDEFYARLHMTELLNGTFLSEDGKPFYITRQHLRDRIGLRTNAASISRAAFDKKTLRRYYEDTLAN